MLASATAPVAQDAAGTSGTFRSTTELVVLQVSVADPQHRFVSGLGVDDFAVFDEGVRQRLALFESAAVPLDLLLLLDASSSMHDRLDLARQAALNLVGALRPDDRAGVVLFHDRVEVAQALSADRSAVIAALNRVRAGGETALYEAIYIGIRELERGRRGGGELRRQAMVVLSDGVDNRSRIDGTELLEAARRSTITIFTIVPEPPEWMQALPVLGNSGTSAFAMKQLARDTGGRHFAPAGFGDLAGIYQDIGSELGGQYWLAFAPPPPSQPGFRRVSVRVATRPELLARTRAGYYANPPRRAASSGVRP